MNQPTLTLLTAVTGPREAELVAALGRAEHGVQVVRRCADLGELLAAASVGLGRAALVSVDLTRLDREAVTRLRRCGLGVVLLAEVTRPDGQGAGLDGADVDRPDCASPAVGARVWRLGAHQVLAAVATPTEIALAVTTAAAEAAAEAAEAATAEEGDNSAAGESRAVPAGRPAGPVGEVRPGGEAATWLGDHGPQDSPGTHNRSPVGGSRAEAVVTCGSRSWSAGTGGGRGAGGCLVAVWGPAGAPGRTTVAVNLAAELAARALPTLLADADTYGPCIAQVLGLLDESAGLAAAVRSANHGSLDLARLASLALVVQPGLRVLTGVGRPSRWPELRPSGLTEVWRVARELAAWTVVDCGFGLEFDEEVTFDTTVPRRNGASLATLRAADVVVAVGSADPVGIQRLARGLQDLREILPPARPRHVVVTRLRQSAVGSAPHRTVTEALAKYAGVQAPLLIPDDRAACDAAVLTGRALINVAPQSPARLAMAELAGSLATCDPGVSGIAVSGSVVRRMIRRGRAGHARGAAP